jgi:hypothetical protein
VIRTPAPNKGRSSRNSTPTSTPRRPRDLSQSGDRPEKSSARKKLLADKDASKALQESFADDLSAATRALPSRQSKSRKRSLQEVSENGEPANEIESDNEDAGVRQSQGRPATSGQSNKKPKISGREEVCYLLFIIFF